MDKPKITPKDFFLWAGAMVALYWSVLAFIFLVFDYINYAFPDPLSYRGDPYAGGLPYDMASLVVMLPIFLTLSLTIRRDIARDTSRASIWVRRWAIIFTMFVAGATIAGDLIILLTSFFRGETLTIAFSLKVLLVFLVATVGFLHFAADLRGYWDRQRARERLICAAVGILGLVSVVAGFFIIGTPAQARLYRFDAEKISDLENIQFAVVNYWHEKRALPTSLAALSDPLSNFSPPADPQSGQAYEYTATGPLTFELCADFNAPTQPYATPSRALPVGPYGAAGAGDSWQHGAGHTCFMRTIDPARYPPPGK